MFGHTISGFRNVTDPFKTKSQRDVRRSNLREKLKEICSLPSFVEITVGDSFFDHGSYYSPRYHITFNITENFKEIPIYSGEETKTTIETRPNSTYLFKKSSTSTWEMYRDGTHCDGDANSMFDDDGYVTETYYAVIDAKDIRKFIKDSGEMINGKDQIDPISDGKFHHVEVYVISEEVFPKGLEELIERMKECRNKALHLFISDKGAEEFVRNSRR